ncbi:MAG: CRISPR-associated endonuclease Cas2 [Candidatus Paceibacterota bacterium]
MSNKLSHSPSVTDLLVATLESGKNVRLFHAILREREFKLHKKGNIVLGLSRLHTKGYAEKSSNGWYLTEKGKQHANKENLFSYITSPFKKGVAATIIVSFDIPEQKRKTRNWLRNQIKIFGYKMLQQSLWIGPGPLPGAFSKRLIALEIKENVKTFKISSLNK